VLLPELRNVRTLQSATYRKRCPASECAAGHDCVQKINRMIEDGTEMERQISSIKDET